MSDEHSSFIKTPKQLIVVVVLAFAVPIALIVLLSQLITGVRPGATEDTETGVLNRIKPVGEVTLAEANAPKGNMSGEQVYQAVCKTCHEAGIAGAPKVGDNGAWGPRIKQSVDQLFAHAINGTDKGMPPKGGNPDLADVEVQRGVVYMANRSGASFKEPPAPAALALACERRQCQAHSRRRSCTNGNGRGARRRISTTCCRSVEPIAPAPACARPKRGSPAPAV